MMKNVKIILASASPRRLELLGQIGLKPELVIPCDLAEEPQALDPRQVVLELSEQKAVHVAEVCKSHRELGASERRAVIGADTVVSLDGEILGKPADKEEAIWMLGRLQGRAHQVFTGVTIILGEEKRSFAEETKVDVYPMTKEEILQYAAGGESMDKAGAYGIQGSFAAFIKELKGSYTNVMGLPVGRLYQELKRLLEELE